MIERNYKLLKKFMLQIGKKFCRTKIKGYFCKHKNFRGVAPA
jgi:hypothetical protein